MKILLAGDNFVKNSLLRAALARSGVQTAEISELTVPWPDTPFHPVAEVQEACGDEAILADAVSDCDIVITQMAPLTSGVLEHTDRLGLIICTRGGPVNVNVHAAAKRGVRVCATPGRNAVAAAEYTVLLMLAAMRNLPSVHNAVARGEWPSELYAYERCGLEMAGSVVGLIGFGEIGQRVAKMVTSMGAEVLVYDPYVRINSSTATQVDLDTLLRRAVVVSVHARLTAETTGLLGAEQVNAMRPGSVLVNTARGGLLNYDAATTALRDGGLAALAVDVYPEEPVDPARPLLSTRGVVLSPHLAGATRQTAERAATMAASECARFLNGDPLQYEVLSGVGVHTP